MKNKRAIVGLLLVAALAPSCFGGGKAPSKNVPAPIPMWQTQQHVPTSSDLRGVIFANAAVGIITGKDGTIFRTGDGGFTWLQEDFTPANRTGDINAVAGKNLKVVAVGSDAGGGREWTSNNTLTWTTPDVPGSGSPYVDVIMAAGGNGPSDPVDVYQLRRDGVVHYTLRTGQTGDTIPDTWVNANGFVNVFPGPPLVPFTYICGENPVNVGQMIRTPAITCTIPANTKTLRRVVLASSGQPFACGDNTSDNGIVAYVTSKATPDTWLAVPNNPGTLPSLQALHFPDSDTGYVVGNSGTIYRLAFDGVNWTWTNQGGGLTTETLYAVYFTDKDHGWAVGDKGTVLRTSNGSAAVGAFWSKMSYGEPGINWNAMAFSDDGVRGIAVGNLASGNAARIYRTINGGATWGAMAIPGGLTTQTLNGVSVPRVNANGTTAYLCGTSGAVYKNTDVWGAGVWDNALITGTSGSHTYRAILFPQAGDKGVLVGDNAGTTPVLLRTSNGLDWGGPTTLPPTLPTAPNASYNALSSNVSGAIVYASGSDGVISVSDLAGGFNTWTDISTATGLTTTLPAIQSPEGASFKAIVAGADGNVYRLSTAGTWTAQTGTPWGADLPISMGFQGGVPAVGDQNGMVVTNTGGVYFTTDGGALWTLTYPHTKAKPRAIWMSPTVLGLGYIGCDDGVIMKTFSSGH